MMKILITDHHNDNKTWTGFDLCSLIVSLLPGSGQVLLNLFT
jgi:hypothetical protein